MRIALIAVLVLSGCSTIHKVEFDDMPSSISIERGMGTHCDKEKPGKDIIGCATIYEGEDRCRISLKETSGVCVLIHELAHCAGADETGALAAEREAGC